MEKKLVTISAQIPSDLLKALQALCEKYERSKSYFIRKAIEYFLENDLNKQEYNEDSNKKIVKK